MEEGSVVKAGEVLATLDNADALAAIAKAKADIDYAKADLAEAQRQERLQQDLFASKVVSQDALDAAKAKVNLAQAPSSRTRRIFKSSKPISTSPLFARRLPESWSRR